MFNFKYVFIMLFFVIFCFIALVFALNATDSLSASNIINSSVILYDSSFVWPTPRFTTITSPFGYRNSPTAGAGTFHGGVDIGAPAGSEIVAAFSGEVTYIGFYGANGYTVQVSNGSYLATYSHVSPHFLVYVGQRVNKGDIIAVVGPKNVYSVPNNPYKDSNGNPTNGATTGPHLHFSLKIDGKSVNPLDYLQK